MSLVKHNNNSISNVTSVNLAQGKMTLISSQTASGSASIEFTSGIDSTYPIYKFEFINLHHQTDNQWIRMAPSINGGSNYNAVNSTSSHFRAWHNETDSSTSLSYYTDGDLAQSTDGQILCTEVGNGNDNSACGTLFLFNPSSTTFVKHYISNFQVLYNASAGYSMNNYVGGYINSTSPVNAIKFRFNSGNIDSGTIKLYGIGD